MLQNLNSLFSYFIFVSIFIIVLAILFFFATKKYSKKKVKLFSLFASLNNRSIILLSSFILNFTLIAFYAVATQHFNSLIVYLIIINNIVAMVVSLNYRVIISNVLYSVISIFSLKIINLVFNYLSLIYYDRLTFILGVIFVLMIIVFEMFITVRLFEIVLKTIKPLGGVKKDGKSRKK